MRHRKLAVNGALIVAAVVLATLGYFTVTGTGGSTPSGVRTATVNQGDVTAAVSASGNITSAMSLGASFTDCTGPLTAIDVKPGQVVSSGQVLATVDSSKAQTAMNNAQAQLAAVQAADYTGGARVGDAVLGSVPTRGALTVTPAVFPSAPAAGGPGVSGGSSSSGGQLAADEAALLSAQNTYKADQLPNSLVNQAVSAAAALVAADKAALAKAQQALTAAQHATLPVPATLQRDQATVVQAQHQLVTDEAGYNSAEFLLTQTLTFDQQSIIYWQAQLTYDKGQGPAPTTPAPVAPSGGSSGAGSSGSASAGGGASGTRSSSATTPVPSAGTSTGSAGSRAAGAAGTATSPSTGSGAAASGSRTSGGTTSGGSATGGSGGAGASATPSQTALNNAQEAVAAAQQTVSDCTLTAPVAGTVITVNGVVGAPPASSASSSASTNASSASTGGGGSSGGASSGGSSGGSSGSSGSAATASSTTASSTTAGTSGFITLSDLGQLQIKGAFSESDVSAVQPGQQASVVFPALTDADDPAGITATGTVTSVDLSSVVTNNVVTYGVMVSLSNPSPRIKLGETGNITVTTASQTGVLTVPTNAITSLGATKTVTVQNGTATQVVPVQVGIAGNGLTEITSGVSEGQKVVLPSATSSSTTSGGFPRTGGGGGGAGGIGGRLGGGS